VLHRALIITALGLSVAGALVFAPRLSRTRRALGASGLWSRLDLAPVSAPRPRHASATFPLLDNGDGVPGTFCPTRPTEPGSFASALDQRNAPVGVLVRSSV